MSSRSLAAARARRAGENAPPVSGNRPGTSIGSYAQQPTQGYPQQSPNVRLARGQQMPPPPPAYEQQQNKASLPFSKLSISDAIGLITLRLGRVEQWVMDTEHENETKEYSDSPNIPENSRFIDNSVLTNMIHRLDSLEKKESGVEDVTKISEDMTKLTEQMSRIADEGIKHNLAISKHTEQLFRFERELVETKDILKTFMIKYDLFATETNTKFSDFEYALSELEKPLEQEGEEKAESVTSTSDANDVQVDLKNIIEQELASESAV